MRPSGVASDPAAALELPHLGRGEPRVLTEEDHFGGSLSVRSRYLDAIIYW